jgi:MFS family permease
MGAWFRRIFVNQNILLLWCGQIVSQSGDCIFRIGLLWLLLEMTGSKSLTGLVAMAAYLPSLLFGLYSGALVDRFDRRRVMLFADAGRAAVVLLIPLVWALDGLSAVTLGVLTFALASLTTLFIPARDTLVGRLVETDRRLTANALIQTSWQYALFLGPAVASVVLWLAGELHLFTVDSITFLVSFCFIYRIRTSPGSTAETAAATAPGGPLRAALKDSWGDVKVGLRYAWRDRRVRGLLLITAVDNLFLMGPAIIGVPLFVREVLHLGAFSYAVLQVAHAIGMVAGTVLVARYGRHFRKGHIVLWGIILDGLTFFPLLWVDTFWGTFAVLAVHSMAIPMIIVPRPTIIHDIVPAEMQGRVFSMISVAVVGFTAVSISAAGLIAEVVPVNVMYAGTAVLAASTGAVGWLIKEFRNLE